MNETFLNLILKNFLKILTAFLILGLFFYIMLPFMISIVLGGVLAMALIPVVDYLEKKKGLSRNMSLVVMSLSLAIVGLIPVVAFVVRGSKVITGMFDKTDINELADRFTKSVYKFVDHFCEVYGVDPQMAHKKIAGFFNGSVNYITETFGDFISELPTVLMVGLITILAMYCFLKESAKIRELFDRYFYFSPTNGEKFIRMLKVSCREVFVSNILTGVLQSFIVSIGALIFGIGDFFLVFFITFIVSFIPIIGAGPVAAVLGVMCFFESRVGAGIGMMVVAGVSGLSDNIIRPYLASMGDAEVHPFIGLLAVIGGVIMFGLPGLFIGPLLASLALGAVPIIVDEFFQEEANTTEVEESNPTTIP